MRRSGRLAKTHHRFRWRFLIFVLAFIGIVGLITFTWLHPFIPTYAPVAAPAAPTRSTAACKGTMLFMGDTMLARSIGDEIIAGKNPYSHVSDVLSAASLRIANIETTIAEPTKAVRASGKLYTFNAPLQAITILQQAHIDASVLANNHTSDFSPSGTSSMLEQFQQAKLATVGAGLTTDAAFQPLVLNMPLRCGQISTSVKIGFIAANDIENVFTKVGEDRAGSAYFDKNRIAASIEQAHQAGAVFVIALPHWGVEYQSTPTARQVEWGHWFIDHGFDAVIGGHPHVIQPTETYNGKPIIYSLGNFIFDQMQDSGANEGQMITLPVTQAVILENQTTISQTAPQLGVPVATAYHLDETGFPVLHGK